MTDNLATNSKSGAPGELDEPSPIGPSRRPLQFGLRSMLIAVAIVSAWLACLRAWPVIGVYILAACPPVWLAWRMPVAGPTPEISIPDHVVHWSMIVLVYAPVFLICLGIAIANSDWIGGSRREVFLPGFFGFFGGIALGGIISSVKLLRQLR